MQIHYPVNPTTGAEDQTQLPWTNGVPQTGQDGSFPPYQAVVEPMEELVNLITLAGLTPSDADLNQVTRAVRGGQLDFDATDTGTADAVLCQVALAHTQLLAGLPFTFVKGPNANTGNAVPTLTITDANGNNGLTGKMVKSGGGALAGGDLPGGALVTVRARAPGVFAVVSLLTISDVLALIQANVSNPANTTYTRYRLTQNTTFYVNGTTGSDANNGLTAATAWATKQHAWNYIQANVDAAGYAITVSCTGGTDNFVASGAVVGLFTPVLFQGNPANPSAINITATAAGGIDSVTAQNGAFIIVDGFQLQSASGYGLRALGAGAVLGYRNCVFGNCYTGHVCADQSGNVLLLQNGTGTYRVIGNSPFHWSATRGGTIYNNPAYSNTITIVNDPTFTAFAYSDRAGDASLTALTFSGSATGPRYFVGPSSIIDTAGGGANYFPGSATGNVAATGSYN